MAQSLKHLYWHFSRRARLWRRSLSAANPQFRAVVRDGVFISPKSIAPIEGETVLRAHAAATWLMRAQDATGDGGVSYGFFPPEADEWEVSYPETTGYIITSLLQYGRVAGRDDAFARAQEMARWEADVQMDSGAVQGGKLTTPDKQRPAAFNTGMVLDGLVSLLECRPCDEVGRAAERAAAFLVDDVSDEGYFRTNGDFVTNDEIKLYNVLCAWAMYRFGELTGHERTKRTAILTVEAALRQQSGSGWFAHNCLTDSRYPLTHTIGYTLQGILEVGAVSGREDFIHAAARGFEPILGQIAPNGYLPGKFDENWRRAVKWSCLTGSAQLSIIGYRLAELKGEARYADAADALVNFLKAVQQLGTDSPEIDGALAGSWPIMGDYMSGGYPNWATKYLLDALMAQAKRYGLSLHATRPEETAAQS